MKDIENYLPLFTSVTEGLPEKGNRGSHYVIVESKKTNDKYPTVKDFFVGSQEWDKGALYEDKFTITHWLDLSKLTTKEKAVKLATESYIKGRLSTGLLEPNSCEQFISEKQKEL